MAEIPYRLLVIEDNEADIFLINKAVRDNDIPVEVTVCSDGESALRLIDSLGAFGTGSPPHAVIVDLSLPRVSGRDVLKSMSKSPAFAGTAVLVFTSSPSPSDVRFASVFGARYLQKPTGVDTYLTEIGRAVKAMLAESAGGRAEAN